MNKFKAVVLAPALLLPAAQVSAAAMSVISATAVPLDSPWALGGLSVLIAVIVARHFHDR
jgi:hypothetical protein